MWPVTGHPRPALVEPPMGEKASSVVSISAEKPPVTRSFSNRCPGPSQNLQTQEEEEEAVATEALRDGPHALVSPSGPRPLDLTGTQDE